MTQRTPISILLVEDNSGDAELIRIALGQFKHLTVGMEHAQWLNSAVTLLTNRTFDAILLDLSLPDSHGVDTVIDIKKVAPNTPIIVLSGREDVEVAVNSVRAGAQDFMVKSRYDTAKGQGYDVAAMERTLLFATERNRNATIGKTFQMSVLRELQEASPPGTIPPPAPAPSAAMVEPHLDAIEKCLAREAIHLQRNSPSSWEAITDIRRSCRVDLSFQEIRSLLNLGSKKARDQDMIRTQPIAQRALQAARAASKGGEDDIVSESDAKAAILNAIDGEN